MDINELSRLSLSSDIDGFLDRRREAEDKYEQTLVEFTCPACQCEFKDEWRIKFPECPRCKNIFPKHKE